MINKKKWSFNVLCLLILAVICFSVGISVGIFTKGMIEGWNSVDRKAQDSAEEFVYATAYFEPSKGMLSTPADTLQCKDGSRLPMTIDKVHMAVPTRNVSAGTMIVMFLLNFGVIVTFVWMIVVFIKFIMRVNRGQIFDERNASLLRKIGWLLLTVALFRYASDLVEHIAVLDTLPEPLNYRHTLLNSLPWSTIIISLVALLMAQIWELGLRMKHEHDLTI